MSTEQTPVEQPDDLDTFSEQLFGQSSTEPEEATSEDIEESADSDAPNDLDTHDDDDAVEDEDVEAPVEKPKKTRFQERIDELTGKQREAERKAQDLEAKLEAAIAKLNEPKTPAPKAEAKSEPDPNDKNEDGSEKYPLGDFDPQYIKDLARFSIAQERETQKQREADEAQHAKAVAERAELQTTWNEKLTPARERYPDLQEKGETLINSLNYLDQGYSSYLSDTLMSLEYGPDVLYYLATHPDEAKKIVDAGPAKATIALGRLDAKFVKVDDVQETRVKVSKAPAPPEHRNKGSAVAKADVDAGTDDLDAFAAKFFKTKRR